MFALPLGLGFAATLTNIIPINSTSHLSTKKQPLKLTGDSFSETGGIGRDRTYFLTFSLSSVNYMLNHFANTTKWWNWVDGGGWGYANHIGLSWGDASSLLSLIHGTNPFIYSSGGYGKFDNKSFMNILKTASSIPAYAYIYFHCEEHYIGHNLYGAIWGV